MRYLGMLLIDLAFFNQLRGVFEHCRPIISLSQGLCCKGPDSDKVLTPIWLPHIPSCTSLST